MTVGGRSLHNNTPSKMRSETYNLFLIKWESCSLFFFPSKSISSDFRNKNTRQKLLSFEIPTWFCYSSIHRSLPFYAASLLSS